MLTAVNKTIRELTKAGELPSSRAAHVELVKLTARRLDRAEDADDGGQVVKLTAQLRGLLAELEPRRGRGDGSSTTEAGAAVGGRAPADLDSLLGAGPTLGHTP